MQVAYRDFFEGLDCHGVRTRAESTNPKDQFDVLPRREIGDKGMFLEDHSDTIEANIVTLRRRQRINIDPLDEHCSRGRLQQARHDIE